MIEAIIIPAEVISLGLLAFAARPGRGQAANLSGEAPAMIPTGDVIVMTGIIVIMGVMWGVDLVKTFRRYVERRYSGTIHQINRLSTGNPVEAPESKDEVDL